MVVRFDNRRVQRGAFGRWLRRCHTTRALRALVASKGWRVFGVAFRAFRHWVRVCHLTTRVRALDTVKSRATAVAAMGRWVRVHRMTRRVRALATSRGWRTLTALFRVWHAWTMVSMEATRKWSHLMGVVRRCFDVRWQRVVFGTFPSRSPRACMCVCVCVLCCVVWRLYTQVVEDMSRVLPRPGRGAPGGECV